MLQGSGSGGIRAPASVEAGSPIPVDVQRDDIAEILVVVGGGGNRKPSSIPVGPSRRALIPFDPAWTPGTLIYITTSHPPFTTIVVEIVPEGV